VIAGNPDEHAAAAGADVVSFCSQNMRFKS
jgi:hypothetical protein